MNDILCIDDDKLFCTLLAKISGLEVKHSRTSDIDVKEAYPLVIIDINLNGESGYEVYANLKSRMLTNYIITSSLLPDIDIAMESGDHVIDKDKLLDLAKRGKLKEWMY